MTVHVEIGGRTRRVELARSGDGWLATLDGRPISIDVVQAGSGWSMLVAAADAVPAGGRSSYEVAIEDRGHGDLTVFIGGQAIDARIVDPRVFERRGRHQGASGGAGLRHVTAPMPGRIVKILVQAGDTVVARQGLVVVEAMKMENELRSPGDAVVREVRVAQGASVDAGTILVILE